MVDDSEEDLGTLSELVTSDDQLGIEDLLMKYQPRLRRMAAARLDSRLASRVDPSDVVQEAFIKAVQEMPGYVRDPAIPLYPWLRQLTTNRLAAAYQQHLHTQRRSVAREVRIKFGLSSASISLLADRLVSHERTPSGEIRQKEVEQQVRKALDKLSLIDREVLILRFIEQLTTQEIATVLGIAAEAVGMRRLRALRRLSEELEGLQE